MEYTEALKTIGQLVQKGRLELTLAQQPFAKQAEVDLKTLRSLEKGERAPWDTTQNKVEKALGWRQGVIREVLDHHEIIPAESITMDYMRDGGGEASWADLSAEEEDNTRPVTRAGLLTNEELIGELAYRLRHKNRGIAGAFLP
ncbi:transcriptional regulator [Pseudarthrobacter sp. NIBRBAC000502771]|uniref:helix-turn-helix domain-containing protein n=1 Tax=Pseudarthrobacter sp. NIBRBAC000502771 TaxID=2590774 RepID=UPI00113027AD|nr:transcriptional regulator [Pseudarthrobacter sp. NIBRBAC000502771]QDG61203.1 transcriptional regulator [Pseudarthrobacter sp. NIBRBAC000502771]